MKVPPLIWFNVFVFLSLAAGTPLSSGGHASLISWPKVQAIKKQYYFPDASRAIVDLVLRDVAGKKIYALHCRPGVLALKPGEAFTLPNHPDFWGEFDCHVHSLYTRDRYESLLIENPLDNDESHSRGEFYDYELQGNCLEYPEWGGKRSFRFRGMRLQLELSDVHFAAGRPGHLAAFRFQVEVDPDPSAMSAISEPPAFALPSAKPGDASQRTLQCDQAVPQHVPGSVTEEYVKDLGLSPPYPVVAATSTKLQIDASRGGQGELPKPEPARFAVIRIKNQDGKPVYEFECDAWRIVGGQWIAGDGLTCCLFVIGNKTNLLLDSVDPYSRMSPAVILIKQLKGSAAKDAEWGNTRHFSLRGFSLTLTFENPVFAKDEFGNPALVRSDLTVEVEPDPIAQTPVAKRPVSHYEGFFQDFGVGR